VLVAVIPDRGPARHAQPTQVVVGAQFPGPHLPVRHAPKVPGVLR
jgi:hypothetical protein